MTTKIHPTAIVSSGAELAEGVKIGALAVVGENVTIGPGTEVEVMVAGICAEVLELDRIGIHDNFFELGGHSLLAMQVISRLGEAFQIELSLRSLFEAPTVADLAKHIETIHETVQSMRDSSPSSTGEREEIEL